MGSWALSFFVSPCCAPASPVLMEGVTPHDSDCFSFSLTPKSSEGAERSGELKLGAKSLPTPALLAHSSHGSPQNLTPDLVAKLSDLKAVHINARDFVVQGPVFEKYGKGGHKFLVLDEQILFLAYNDPSEFDATPVQGKSLNLNALGGKRKIDAAGWLKLQTNFRAELYSALSYDVQFYSGNKRLTKCVDATIAWLDELLPPHATNPKSAHPKTADGTFKPIPGAMFAVIQGGNNDFERKRCIKAITDRIEAHHASSASQGDATTSNSQRRIQGFIYGGFGLDDLPEDRARALAINLSSLPADYPRLLPTIESPEEILDAVSMGIDLFSNSYAGRIAQLGHAFSFATRFLATGAPSAQPADVPLELGGDRNKMNLHDGAFELDQRPLIEGCACYACQKHTRAYIHHLINTHEMLATILLVIHNTHHYLDFFSAIRESIQRGSFAKYKSDFLELYRKPLSS